MTKVVTSLLLLTVFQINMVSAEDVSQDIAALKTEVATLVKNHERVVGANKALANRCKQNEAKINALETENKRLSDRLDSVRRDYALLADSQQADKAQLTNSIQETDGKVKATEDRLSSSTMWGAAGIAFMVVALAVTIWVSARKRKRDELSMDEVRKAQQKIQEEAVRLDSKLVELLGRQSVSAPVTGDDGGADHSLTLKVADEIVRIEMNLSRMDKSIKGYKQLEKGVQRIKDNFAANGYEIVDMLGKHYQAGMKAAVTFVTDENLDAGQQIITRIIKPQVNYRQQMIQAAQIEVSQSE